MGEVVQQVLDISEQQAVSAALIRMIQESPMIKGSKIKVRHATVDLGILGEFPQQGTVYVRRYVSGSFVAQYAYFLRFRYKPVSDQSKIAEEQRLDALARWLEGQAVTYKGTVYRLVGYPPLDEQRSIEQISNTSGVFVAEEGNDGTIDIQVHMQLRYFKKQ